VRLYGEGAVVDGNASITADAVEIGPPHIPFEGALEQSSDCGIFVRGRQLHVDRGFSRLFVFAGWPRDGTSGWGFALGRGVSCPNLASFLSARLVRISSHVADAKATRFRLSMPMGGLCVLSQT